MTLLQCPETDHGGKDPNDENKILTIDKKSKVFARFALEELARRQIKKEANSLTVDQILDLFVP